MLKCNSKRLIDIHVFRHQVNLFNNKVNFKPKNDRIILIKPRIVNLYKSYIKKAFDISLHSTLTDGRTDERTNIKSQINIRTFSRYTMTRHRDYANRTVRAYVVIMDTARGEQEASSLCLSSGLVDNSCNFICSLSVPYTIDIT
jgi:hypothetical protein